MKAEKFSAVFEVNTSTHAQETIVCLHPGGVSSKHYNALVDSPNAQLLVVELSLLPQYQLTMTSHEENTLKYSMDDIVNEVYSQLQKYLNKTCQKVTIIGWSFGGVLGYALADRLTIPCQLVALDSIAPLKQNQHCTEQVAPSIVYKWFIEFISAVKACELIIETPYSSYTQDEFVAMVFEHGLAQGIFKQFDTLNGVNKLFETFALGLKRNMLLSARFFPKPQPDLNILVIRSHSGLQEISAYPNCIGWSKLSSNVHIVNVEKDHYALFTDTTSLATIYGAISVFSQLRLRRTNGLLNKISRLFNK
ncbi:thioesterase domain-containing protein [Pseudoalteromonas sp. SMS1]|uniref:thioesterase domain-containing protein n=1 Tax=Pseudoalteromonas sp. SMS1 TaxID=2908894 RepID=UPI001F34532B|nr:thioesterase domain-containing protein [Pseudoalteromonas sp. SMS1]MCF2858935.1 thioesterase domain-containing protein [Pseudoalteromonas sp. SMS1]